MTNIPNADDPRTIARSLLTAKEWEAWEAINYRGWSHRQLAQATCISHTAVQDRLARANRKLAQYARAKILLNKPEPPPAPSTATMIVNLLIERDGPNCYLCRKPATPSSLTVDHVIPRAKGGTDAANNLALACRICNSKKGATYVSLLVTSGIAVYHPI